MSKKINILVISNESWSDIWFSKHHYANELSKSHKVIFVNPAERWKFRNLFVSEIKSNSVSPSLKVISYVNFLPHYFLKLNNRIISARLKRYFEKSGFQVDVCWTFDPIRLFDMKALRAKKSIFHIVDKYLFSFKSEIILHKNVDGFVVVAEEFKKPYEHYKKPILFVPHGVPSFEDVDPTLNITIPYKNYILYMGMIDGRLDYKMIKEMVISLPNEIFLFLGNFGQLNSSEFVSLFIKKEFKNLVHVPAVHALKLKYYIENAKCCLAPMKQDWEGNMISHHKIFQYLSYGKAVFSPEFSSYLGFSKLLYMENDTEKSLAQLKNYLEMGEDPDLNNERILLVRKNTYELHSRNILDFIDKI